MAVNEVVFEIGPELAFVLLLFLSTVLFFFVSEFALKWILTTYERKESQKKPNGAV